jgi:pimeloyl-ACP methyl ester carboxylesterase
MEVISLSAQTAGEAGQRPLVILHGLLGSSRNWAGMLKLLSPDFSCHALDLRNHGDSPHTEAMSYAEQAADVVAYLDKAGIEQCSLLGHSMGGKVAMAVACRAPERVSHLVVVDIAPKSYPPRWGAEFAAMRALPVSEMSSRGEAEKALESTVSDWAFRKFLLSNLIRQEGGGFEWKVNLPLLESALPEIFAHSLAEDDQYSGPTLFLRGGKSNYVSKGDLDVIRQHFPCGKLETIKEAGHNVHFEQPEAFKESLSNFFTG